MVKTNQDSGTIADATFHTWNTPADFAAGSSTGGLVAAAGGLTLETDTGDWTSGWHEPGASFTALTVSWQADTPGSSWISVELQVRTATTESPWLRVGDWAFETTAIKRQTVSRQKGDGPGDLVGSVLTDAFEAAEQPPGGAPIGYRVRVVLHGGIDRPTVRQLAVATVLPAELPPTSRPSLDAATELDVPRYSQSIHRDEYPEFGGGGQVWCSPASTSMVMAFWGVHPDPAELAALPPDEVFDRNGRSDPVIPWAAAHCWDYVYNGAGGWAFNTAYASAFGLDGSVRYGTSLRDIEEWIARGVPVVVSIAWRNDDGDESTDMEGSWITGTGGHLMVVVGFTDTGDVIANDPASPSNEEVRRIYRRDQFERNWLRASNGAMYIIKDQSVPG